MMLMNLVKISIVINKREEIVEEIKDVKKKN